MKLRQVTFAGLRCAEVRIVSMMILTAQRQHLQLRITSTVKDLLRSINSLETSLEVVLSQPFVIVCNATIMKYYMLPRKTEVSL